VVVFLPWTRVRTTAGEAWFVVRGGPPHDRDDPVSSPTRSTQEEAMSSYPTDDSVHPTTPLFDETVSTTSVYVDTDDTDDATFDDGSSSRASQAKDTAKDTANQAKDTAKETAGQAKEQAKQVGSTAADAGQRVASTTKDQASRVATDALGQARELYSQATEQLSEQASKQQQNAASALHTLGDDLSKMHEQHEGGGLAAELVQNVSQRADSIAEWLENREPGEVLDEVKQFAARRPGLFIALAAVTGVVAARATKALVADAKPDLASGLTGGSSGSKSDTSGPTFDDTTAGDAYAGEVQVPAVDDPYGTRTYGTTGAYGGAGLGDVR
jgi:hypothetical protein